MAAVRYLDKVERWPNRMAAVRHLGGVSDDFRPDGMSYAMHRKGAVFVAKGKEATRHFLGRITMPPFISSVWPSQKRRDKNVTFAKFLFYW